MRVTGIVVAALLLASCSTPPGQREPAPFARERGIIATSELPAGFIKLDPVAKNFLRVSGDPLALEASDESNGNVTMAIASRNHDMTMVSVAATTEGKLKLDFYISPDGERWQYTSSCPVSTVANYETWPHDITHIAVANPRYVAGDRAGLCD